MNWRRMLLFAGIGWLAGALLVLLMGFAILPAIFGGKHSLFDPVDQVILGFVLLAITPGALLGGAYGGRMIAEGSGRSQILTAIMIGVLLATPCSCVSFWYLGWVAAA